MHTHNYWTESMSKTINMQAMIDQAVRRTVDTYAPGDTTIHLHKAGANCIGVEHLQITNKNGSPHIVRVIL